MLRAPLLPTCFLQTIPDAPDKLLPWLEKQWNTPKIRAGVVLGSYEFSKQIDDLFSSNKKTPVERGLLYSLLRYLSRYASRCTPFGIFAGFATGSIGQETDIRLTGPDDHKLHARLDMEYLVDFSHLLESDQAIREQLIFIPNSTLFQIGSNWHYIEVKKPSAKSRKVYDVVTIEDGGYLRKVLSFCSQGRQLADIRASLAAEGWESSEVIDFVDSLVDAQVIVSNLYPVVCGPEYMDKLIDELTPLNENHPLVQSLIEVKQVLNRITDSSSVIENLPRAHSILKAIDLPINRSHLVQIDMQLGNQSLVVDEHIAGQVLLGLRIMKALSSGHGYDPLKGFREAFTRRFDNRKIPITKVLDPETGIGLDGQVENYWTDPVSWIEDLNWGPGLGVADPPTDSMNFWLAARYLDVVKSGSQYLELDTPDIQLLDIHQGIWPRQLTAMVELSGSFDADGPNIHFLLGISGNPAYLMGRFGFADPNGTQQWVHQLVQDQQADQPEVLFAEVVHLPEDRTGNILQRPSFFDFEIPYLAQSAKGIRQQIPLTDLLVTVENQQIVLYSASLGKKVMPCMTNAYNHEMGHLAVYKFLHRVRLQGTEPAYKPSWGPAARYASFIPGIRFKNLTLLAPVWIIHCGDIRQWFSSDKTRCDTKALIAWKNERKMPDEMLWMSSDQELYFNWTNRNLMIALWDVVEKFKQIKVRPFYLSEASPVQSSGGYHSNQFIFSFHQS